MFEHPSFTYDAIVIEREYMDRENERRRLLTEHPERIVPRRHRLRAWLRAR